MFHNGLHLHETFGGQRRLRFEHEPLTVIERLFLGAIWAALCLSLTLGVGLVVGLGWLLVVMVREVFRLVGR